MNNRLYEISRMIEEEDLITKKQISQKFEICKIRYN